jgi:DNA-binding MarR family transcriptional regulator
MSYTKGFAMARYEDCIMFLLAKAYQRAQGVVKKRVNSFGLTAIQHLFIEALWEEDELTAGDIGDRLILDHATVSGVLDRMEEGGWISKKTDPEDKRFIRVYLSDKARELGPTLFKERELANEEILAQLTQEEKVLLKRLLRTIRG